jgi:hypothetical protein
VSSENSELDLVEIILNETFRKIEQLTEFTETNIIKLKELAQSGNLTQQTIIPAIKMNEGG